MPSQLLRLCGRWPIGVGCALALPEVCTVVGPASRLDEAMELAREAELDCAVLDVNLGGQPIFPLADLLREKGAPFAFATGYSPDDILPPEHANVPVLAKPYSAAEVRATLDRLRISIAGG